MPIFLLISCYLRLPQKYVFFTELPKRFRVSAFVRVAQKGENHWAFYLLTIVVVLLGFVVGQWPLMSVIEWQIAREALDPEKVEQFRQTADFDLLGLPSYVSLLLVLLGFMIAAAVLAVMIRFVHKRPVKTVITPHRRIHFSKIGTAFLLWMALAAVAEVGMYLLTPESYTWHWDASKWLPLVVVCILFLPVQTTFEEVFVRGYLLQGLGLLTHHKWSVILLTSCIFAGMHLGNPEIREFGTGIMVIYYFSVALFLAVITFLDDGLEMALGIHAATNIYGASVVTFTGSALQTDALVFLEEVNPALSLAFFYAMAVVFYVIVKKKYRLYPLRSLFTPIRLGTDDNDEQE